MSASTFSSQLVPAPVLRAMGATPSGWLRLGEQARPMGKTLLSLVDVVLYYRAELLRQVAAMSLGTASLAVIGGTVAVMTFLTMSTGGAPAGGGYNQLASGATGLATAGTIGALQSRLRKVCPQEPCRVSQRSGSCLAHDEVSSTRNRVRSSTKPAIADERERSNTRAKHTPGPVELTASPASQQYCGARPPSALGSRPSGPVTLVVAEW